MNPFEKFEAFKKEARERYGHEFDVEVDNEWEVRWIARGVNTRENLYHLALQLEIPALAVGKEFQAFLPEDEAEG